MPLHCDLMAAGTHVLELLALSTLQKEADVTDASRSTMLVMVAKPAASRLGQPVVIAAPTMRSRVCPARLACTLGCYSDTKFGRGVNESVHTRVTWPFIVSKPLATLPHHARARLKPHGPRSALAGTERNNMKPTNNELSRLK